MLECLHSLIHIKGRNVRINLNINQCWITKSALSWCHGHSLVNKDITVGWESLLSTMMIQLSVTSWQRCWNCGWMWYQCSYSFQLWLRQLWCHGAGRVVSCALRYSNYSAWHAALKWDQTASYKRLWVMKIAEQSLQYWIVYCGMLLQNNTQNPISFYMLYGWIWLLKA